MKSQLLRFGLVGVAGYVVDSGVLYGALALGLGPTWGRLLSFLCAVATTWLLNRRFTFDHPAQGLDTHSLVQEALRYLSAMLMGGLLNLITYGWIMQTMPSHPALPALAVAAGSLVGMVANFAGAKWWVYKDRPASSQGWRRHLFRQDGMALAVLQLIFWFFQLYDASLPGLYMDAANPDYLAARALNPTLSNPVWIMPTALFPVLGSPYHGVQNFYAGLPVFALLGFNMLALRIAQGLFGASIVAATYLVSKRITSSTLIAFGAAAGLATDLAFIASFRTQNYIVISGCIWLLSALYLIFTAKTDKPPGTQRRLFYSGVCAGLAVYSYFVFLFFLPAFVALIAFNSRHWKPLLDWLKGFVTGMLTYVLGYSLLIVQLRGFMPAKEWMQQTLGGLNPLSSQLTLQDSIQNAWACVQLALRNTSNELMIFGTDAPSSWSDSKPLFFGLCALISIWPLVSKLFTPPAPGRSQASFSFLKPSQLVAFPIAFFVCALYFGNRLWGHHFSSLIPLVYLLFAVALMVLTPSNVARKWMAPLIVSSLILGNLWQQQPFFERLEQTGGQGKFSDAINHMASDALSMPPHVVHVFPEWGLMMPFAFLTGNQRVYMTEVNAEPIQRLAQQGRPIRLFYFKPEDAEKYNDQLTRLGLRITDKGAYLQRNQQPAFYWVQAQ
jgi:putative flippase GtrA